MSGASHLSNIRLQLPATSANLGPGFDAIGLAMGIYLTVEARQGSEFKLTATGWNVDVCGRLEGNLIVDTYLDVLKQSGRPAVPLEISLQNEIPLGMGCGSSAAALLAGVALANHFGEIGMDSAGIVREASRREGHPDNVAACWLGGFTASAQNQSEVLTATFAGNPSWRIMLVVPEAGLATSKARALLPESYAKADAIHNVQRTALLVAAFAQRRLDLLRTAMEDRLHQPYRQQACPLLAKLLPISGTHGIAGIALSGAGPSVLMILEKDASIQAVEAQVRAVAGPVEMMVTSISRGAHELSGGAAGEP